jgi:microcystin-dependent protein
MGVATGFTAERMLEIENSSIVGGFVDTNGHLLLKAKDNSQIDAGNVVGPITTGIVNMYAGAVAPSGWLLCDGTAISRTTYAALFAVIGTAYGNGDGVNTFNLPNLKGRIPVGFDAAQTEFAALGQTGGEKAHSLSIAEMPSHTHVQNSHGHTMTDPGHNHTQNSHGHGTTDLGHNHRTRITTRRTATATRSPATFTTRRPLTDSRSIEAARLLVTDSLRLLAPRASTLLARRLLATSTTRATRTRRHRLFSRQRRQTSRQRRPISRPLRRTTPLRLVSRSTAQRRPTTPARRELRLRVRPLPTRTPVVEGRITTCSPTWP